eukprot:5121139-Pyramimonas_sp.AAC.1
MQLMVPQSRVHGTPRSNTLIISRLHRQWYKRRALCATIEHCSLKVAFFRRRGGHRDVGRT